MAFSSTRYREHFSVQTFNEALTIAPLKESIPPTMHLSGLDQLRSLQDVFDRQRTPVNVLRAMTIRWIWLVPS